MTDLKIGHYKWNDRSGFACNGWSCVDFFRGNFGRLPGRSGIREGSAGCRRKERVDVDGRVFRGVLKAESDFGIAEARLSGGAIGDGKTGTEQGFDFFAKDAANAIEVAGDAGFVFAQSAANGGESVILEVVGTKALRVARIKASERGLEGATEEGLVAIAMRVCGRSGGDQLGNGIFGLRLAIDINKAAGGADGVNMALGENGAKPGLQRAAAMKIAEEGAIGAAAIGDSIEVGEERIGQVASFGRIGGTAENGGSRGAEIRPIGGDEVFPGGFGAFGASASESEILEMKAGKEVFELVRVGRRLGKMLGDDAVEGGAESFG